MFNVHTLSAVSVLPPQPTEILNQTKQRQMPGECIPSYEDILHALELEQ
jgi:hypothetical protein